MRKPTPPSPLRQKTLAAALIAGLLQAGAAQAGVFVLAQRNLPDMKAMFGQIESRDITPARTQIGGVIVNRFVDEGAEVKAGQVIAVVTDQKLALQAQALDGQLSALNSQLDNANVAFKRAQDLLPKGFVTKAAFDQAKTNVDVLSHQVDSMRSQRAVIAQQMKEGEVLAPRDGRVLTMSAIPGSVVMPGEAIARIAAGALFLRLSLPERHAELLQLGAPVTLVPREGEPAGAIEAEPRKGKIVKIYPEIENGRVIADAEVTNLDRHFIGERVQVFALVGRRDVLLVPSNAVTTRSGVDYVRLQQAKGTLDVAVVFAESSEPGMVEILSGLRPGDKVITP